LSISENKVRFIHLLNLDAGFTAIVVGKSHRDIAKDQIARGTIIKIENIKVLGD